MMTSVMCLHGAKEKNIVPELHKRTFGVWKHQTKREVINKRKRKKSMKLHLKWRQLNAAAKWLTMQ
jgi:hypothetical protein